MKKTLINEILAIKKQMGIIKEGSGYEYGCAMLYFAFDEMDEIHNLIDPEDIYTESGDNTFGLEDEPHTTLLFGLHDGIPTSEIEKILSEFTYSSCKVFNASIFKNPKYDVLKFDVEGDYLKETNEMLKELPFTSDFPDYHPHLTIGYIQSGKGEKYVEMLKGKEYWLLPQFAVYSKPNGTKDKINIRVD